MSTRSVPVGQRPQLDSVPPRQTEERTTIRPTLSAEQTGRPGLATKIARAERLLGTLSPSDARTRLLGTAIARRDESLLDALLREPVNVK